MSKTLFIFLSLSFALLLRGDSGIASDTYSPEASGSIRLPAGEREKTLALFIDALLEKDPDVQCKKILETAAADPANAETPLKAFFSSFKKAKDRKCLLDQFNSIWQKHPDNFYFTVFGADLNQACGTSAKERLKLLDKINSLPPSALWSSPRWTRDMSEILLRSTAACYMELKQYDKIQQLFEKWKNAPLQHALPLYVTLGGICHTAAAKSYCSGNAALGKGLEKCYNDSVAGLEKIAPSVNDNQGAVSVLLFYSTYRSILGDKLVRFAQSFYLRVPSADANVLRLKAASDCGNLQILNEAAKEIIAVNPRYNFSELRFKAFLNAGKFAEAEKEIAAMPEKLHWELQKELYIKQKAWKKLHALVTDRLSKGAPADAASGIIILSTAEHLKNLSLYRQALGILAPHLNIPAVANAVGYISAELNQNLAHAQKLLEFALSKEPGNYAYLDSMAWICFKQKRYAEAEKWINKALAAATPREGMAVILEHAGDIAAVRGKNPRTWYELAVKYAPFDNECNPAEIMKKLKALK